MEKKIVGALQIVSSVISRKCAKLAVHRAKSQTTGCGEATS